MKVKGILLKNPGANAHKSNAVAVVWVEVGVYFKHKTRELLVFRLYFPRTAQARSRLGSNFYKGVEQFLHPKVVERTAEKYWSHFAYQIGLAIVSWVKGCQLGFLAQLRGVFANNLVEFGVVEVLKRTHFVGNAGFIGGKQVELLAVHIVNAFKSGAFADGPGEGRDFDAEFFFKFLQQIERILAFAVHFIDKNDHRRIAHAAHGHKLFGLLFHAFGGIYHQNHRVYRRQGAVRIFGEVFVTRRVQNIHAPSVVLKAHHRGGDRNATLLFNFHEVGSGRFFDFVAFYGTGRLNSTAKKQEFFGEGGLARIGVRNNGEGATTGDFLAAVHGLIIRSRKNTLLFSFREDSHSGNLIEKTLVQAQSTSTFAPHESTLQHHGFGFRGNVEHAGPKYCT